MKGSITHHIEPWYILRITFQDKPPRGGAQKGYVGVTAVLQAAHVTLPCLLILHKARSLTKFFTRERRFNSLLVGNLAIYCLPFFVLVYFPLDIPGASSRRSHHPLPVPLIHHTQEMPQETHPPNVRTRRRTSHLHRATYDKKEP